MDFKNGIKNPVDICILSVIAMIIGCNFYINVGAFYCITVCYTGTDTQYITPNSHEEYHPRQVSTVEYFCLETLYPHTEEKLASQHRV